jgi:hypothetical protein
VNLREGDGKAASVLSTDAATESPDPWRSPMPGGHLTIRLGPICNARELGNFNGVVP